MAERSDKRLLAGVQILACPRQQKGEFDSTRTLVQAEMNLPCAYARCLVLKVAVIAFLRSIATEMFVEQNMCREQRRS